MTIRKIKTLVILFDVRKKWESFTVSKQTKNSRDYSIQESVRYNLRKPTQQLTSISIRKIIPSGC